MTRYSSLNSIHSYSQDKKFVMSNAVWRAHKLILS